MLRKLTEALAVFLGIPDDFIGVAKLTELKARKGELGPNRFTPFGALELHGPTRFWRAGIWFDVEMMPRAHPRLPVLVRLQFKKLDDGKIQVGLLDLNREFDIPPGVSNVDLYPICEMILDGTRKLIELMHSFVEPEDPDHPEEEMRTMGFRLDNQTSDSPEADSQPSRTEMPPKP
jgi:hypothetical protein